MGFNRRDWLKTAFLGGAAFAFSPLEILAKQTPNYLHLKNDNEAVRLCFNENPFGVSPKAIEAMQKSLLDASKYDFKYADVLKSKLAEKNQLHKDNFLVSAGSSFLLELIAKYVSIDRGHIVIPEPSFTIFAPITEFLGMTKTEVPLNFNKEIDLDVMLKSIKTDTKLVYICNPNNPTGHLLTREQVENFVKKVPENITILIDEAYIEFTNQPSFSNLVNQYKNIIVTRTFSKLYGFAGARLGYAISNPETLKKLEKLQSWSGGEISIITMAGGIAALDDIDFISKVKKNNQLAKEFVIKEFTKKEIKVIPSHSNFIYFSLDNYQGNYFSKLKSAKILGGKTYEENGKWTRISIGTMDQMQKYIKAIFD